MKHPLSSFGSYGDDADFSNQDIVDDSSDFGKEYCMGDFGNNYGEDAYNEGLQGFDGEDEGLGFKFKKPKFKKLNPIKSAAKLAKKAAKRAAKLAKKAAKIAAKNPVTAQLNQLKAVAAAVPGVAQSQAILSQVADVAAKAGIPAAAIMSSLITSPQQQAIVQSQAPSSQESNQAIEVAPESTVAVTQAQAEINKVVLDTPKPSSFQHPLLYKHKKMKGEPMSGFLDDLTAQISKAATSIYQTNKDKAIAAATTQASNLVGKTLTKLNTSSPEAQKAIASVVQTATNAAQATAMEKAKMAFEENKKYIYMGGAAVAGLIILKMLQKKKLA